MRTVPCHARGGKLRERHIVVGSVDGQDDQGLDAAQACGQQEDADTVAEAARGRKAGLGPPLKSNASMAPNPLIWRLARRWSGCEARPG